MSIYMPISRSTILISRCKRGLQRKSSGEGDSNRTERLLHRRKASLLTSFRGQSLPLGILNLLSFLYHRQPCGVFTIFAGYSVSGQSKAFNVKSVANNKNKRVTVFQILEYNVHLTLHQMKTEAV